MILEFLYDIMADESREKTTTEHVDGGFCFEGFSNTAYCSCCFLILPVAVRGNSVTNSTMVGTLNLARREAQ